MNIHHTISRRQTLILVTAGSFLVFFLVVFGALYAARAQIREQILPSYIYSQHGVAMQKTLEEQTKSINQLLTPVGLSLEDETPFQCVRSIANGISTSVSCYGETGGSLTHDLAPSDLTVKLDTLGEQLKANGWRGKIQRVSDSSYGIAISYFDKNIDGLHCSMQIIEELPNTLQGRFLCSRSFNILGDPSDY